MGFFIVAAIAGAFVVALWFIGAREPAYTIATGEPAWFVAVRASATPELAANVKVAWTASADFAFIGAPEAYWQRFYILAGGDPSRTPIDLSHIEDAYVARIELAAPPKLALGLLAALVAIGVLGKPRGEVGGDVQAKGYRGELMPDSGAVSRLLARPGTYGPSMVNFLRYYPSAKYKNGASSSGRAAYARYGMVALRTVYRTGGHLLFYGRVRDVAREATGGPTIGAWSDVAAMHYPNPTAILSMEHVAAYRAALHHRDAGLERTVVIASTQQPLTD